MGLCCVWSSGTHSQTRRTGSPHTQSLQSVRTTLHLRNGVCVVCGPVVHTAKPGELDHRTRNRYRVYHSTPTQWVCVVCGPVVHTAKPGELYQWYLHSVAIACATDTSSPGLAVCTTGPHTAKPLRRCRVVLTLCSDCVCGDSSSPGLAVCTTGPQPHQANWTPHTHCVGVSGTLHSVAIACAVMFAWFGCVYHWTTPRTGHRTPLRRCKWYLHSVAQWVCVVCGPVCTHSQTRQTGSPHTQSLQSVSTTLHLRNGFGCVWSTGHTAKPGKLDQHALR